MIIELKKEKTPTEPGYYFVKTKLCDHTQFVKVTEANGNEYWQFSIAWDKKYHGLAYESGPLSELIEPQWSEKLEFRWSHA